MLIKYIETGVQTFIFQIAKNRWAFRLIGVAVFIVILLRIDLREMWRILRTVDLMFVLLSLLLQAIGLAISTLRWQLIMNRLNIQFPFIRSFAHQLIGTAAALVTPGQLGEFVKVLYHRQEGVPVAESLLSVIVDRAYDLVMLLLFGFIAFAILVGLSPPLTVGISLVGGVMLLTGFLLARRGEQFRPWLTITLTKIGPKPYRKALQENALQLAGQISQFKLSFLFTCTLLTVFNYTFLLFRVYALVLALHLDVPFWYFAMVVPLLRLVGLIPISVLGLGTRDLTAIYLLGQVGVSEEAALLVSALGLITLQIQALIGLVMWQRYPLHFQKADLGGFKEIIRQKQGLY